MSHNSSVIDDPGDGSSPSIDRSQAAHHPHPCPIPELETDQQSSPVTDEDRTRYGLLLDRAAERGLLTPYEYEIRLRELAEATSTDQMRQIVTELPAFAVPAATAPSARARRKGSSATSGGTPPATAGRGPRTSRWVALVVLVVLIAASLVVLAIYAEHLVRRHTGGLAVPAVSVLRL